MNRKRPQSPKGKSFGPETAYHDPAAPKIRRKPEPRRQSTRKAAVQAAVREARR